MKFVAPVAVSGVNVSQMLFDQISYLSQQSAAAKMAVRVID